MYDCVIRLDKVKVTLFHMHSPVRIRCRQAYKAVPSMLNLACYYNVNWDFELVSLFAMCHQDGFEQVLLAWPKHPCVCIYPVWDVMPQPPQADRPHILRRKDKES